MKRLGAALSTVSRITMSRYDQWDGDDILKQKFFRNPDDLKSIVWKINHQYYDEHGLRKHMEIVITAADIKFMQWMGVRWL